MNHFLVTGCGRSGTTYIARFLCSLGCKCGHEKLFNPISTQGRLPLPWPDYMPGESSWLAVPYLEALPAGTLVLHQVRSPLGVIRSSVRNRFFDRSQWDKTAIQDEQKYREYLHITFIEQHIRGIYTGTPVEKAMKYWLEWNRLAERAEKIPGLRYLRYRVEDIQERLGQILDLIGFRCDKAEVSEALARFPSNYNTRGPVEMDSEIQWSTLPEGTLKQELLQQAQRYGYQND